jgi:hypothetical protein
MPAATQVYNGEATMAQKDVMFIKHTSVIGPTVHEGVQRGIEPRDIPRLVTTKPSEYAAHQ